MIEDYPKATLAHVVAISIRQRGERMPARFRDTEEIFLIAEEIVARLPLGLITNKEKIEWLDNELRSLELRTLTMDE